MWFKQIQLLKINESLSLSPDSLITHLTPFAFRPCLPSMQSSMGWIPPVHEEEDNAPLIRAMNGYIMICLQI